MTSTVLFVGNLCVKYIQVFQRYLRGVVTILQITGKRIAALTSTFTNVLGRYGTLTARALQGLRASRSRIARSVAFAIGIGLSMPMQALDAGQIEASQSDKVLIKSLANYQLTDKQYKCHNEIVYRESRWNFSAVGNLNGSKRVYGGYQIKSEYIKGAHPEVQFWKYWQYVSTRYGITEYDEPMYCAALNHLVRRGWQ